MKLNGYGYVYLAGFKYFEYCYKIGSTKDPLSRLCQLELQYGPSEIIVCGDCDNKLRTEKTIQRALYKYSNKFRIRNDKNNLQTFLGPALSSEHFIFDHTSILDAYSLFNEHCDGLLGRDYYPIRVSSHILGEP
jgi:hypothetical protein